MEDKCIKKYEDVEAKIIDDETLILEPESGGFFRLNETGTEVWKNTNGKTKIKDIARKISKDFDVKENIALKDVVNLVKQLKKNKLIKLC